MAARAKKLVAAALILAACASVSAQAPRRIVSLVPALTEMLFAIGAGPQVVGVSTYDAYPAEVKTLPRVGALIDPNVERILTLRPDMVITYGSQTDLETQLARAKIKSFAYRHGGIATILQTIRDLGVETGRRADADRLVADLQRRLDAIKARVKNRPKPKVLLVFERQPRTLREIYACGGRGFLHEMIEIAGGRNVFADTPQESVQPSTETLIARAPDVIIEVRAEGLIAESEVAGEKAVWSALSSIPAVRNQRVHLMTGSYLVVPGPRLAQATEALAKALHPAAFTTASAPKEEVR